MKESLVNKITNSLYTLTIYHENDEVSITEGTILCKLMTDLMSKSQPIMLMCNVRNNKAVVTKGSSSIPESLPSIHTNKS